MTDVRGGRGRANFVIPTVNGAIRRSGFGQARRPLAVLGGVAAGTGGILRQRYRIKQHQSQRYDSARDGGDLQHLYVVICDGTRGGANLYTWICMILQRING